jgi:hypothetical protein
MIFPTLTAMTHSTTILHSRNRSHVKIPGAWRCGAHSTWWSKAGLARDGATTIGCTTVRAHAEHAQMRGVLCSHNNELEAERRTTGQEPSGMAMMNREGTSSVGREPPTLGQEGGSGKASAAPRDLAGQEPRRTGWPAEAMRPLDGLAPFTFPMQNGTGRPGQGSIAREEQRKRERAWARNLHEMRDMKTRDGAGQEPRRGGGRV